jgi:hypothetical protein
VLQHLGDQRDRRFVRLSQVRELAANNALNLHRHSEGLVLKDARTRTQDVQDSNGQRMVHVRCWPRMDQVRQKTVE